MKRRKVAAGLVSAMTLALGLAFIPAAHASSVNEPSDCTGRPAGMTCTARPAGQQWQIVVTCLPQGTNGGDWTYYGNIVTGNGYSKGKGCTGPHAVYGVTFSDSGLQPPGLQ